MWRCAVNDDFAIALAGKLYELLAVKGRRALDAAWGHPKLLELADAQAARPERLAALAEAGDQAWRTNGGLPEGFFTDGSSGATGTDYLQILAGWSKSVAQT